MSDNREKTSNFLKAINKYAEQQRTKIRNEAEEFKKQELEKAEAEVLNDAYSLIQREMAQMRTGIAGSISRKEMDSRRELFQKRQAITDKVFKSAEEKLIEFTKTGEYTALLQKYAALIANVLTQDGTVLYLKKEDMHLSDKIKSAFGRDCSVESSDDILIGGIYGQNYNMGIIADETLDSKLLIQRDWFAENSGMNLF